MCHLWILFIKKRHLFDKIGEQILKQVVLLEFEVINSFVWVGAVPWWVSKFDFLNIQTSPVFNFDVNFDLLRIITNRSRINESKIIFIQNGKNVNYIFRSCFKLEFIKKNAHGFFLTDLLNSRKIFRRRKKQSSGT